MSREQEILQRIERAVTDATPDVLPEILLRLDERKGDSIDMTYTAEQANHAPLHFPTEEKKPRTGTRWRAFAATAAAALLLAVGGRWGYMHLLPQSTIGFDVNPSVELSINRAEKVLQASALNEDGAIVLEHMNLRNVDLDVAVNALVGSMVRHGYIDELKNSILISVNSSNGEKGQELQARLSQEVSELLHAFSVEGAVLSQRLEKDEATDTLAATYGISAGKAALIGQLTTLDDTLQAESLAKLSVNDINLLLESKRLEPQNVIASGQASNGAYIGEDAALSIALSHAGVQQEALIRSKVELDYDDGRMVYDLEFYTSGMEYDYEIDATNGSILDYEQETHRQPAAGSTSGNSNAAGGTAGSVIGSSKAKEIALKHAGATAANIRKYEIDLDHENGRKVYEIEFMYNGLEYEYDIDAITGEIIRWESKRD